MVRSVAQMLAVLVGGAVAGGLLVLAAFPDTTAPVPPAATLAGAAVVATLALWAARRLRPSVQSGRGRRKPSQ